MSSNMMDQTVKAIQIEQGLLVPLDLIQTTQLAQTSQHIQEVEEYEKQQRQVYKEDLGDRISMAKRIVPLVTFVGLLVSMGFTRFHIQKLRA